MRWVLDNWYWIIGSTIAFSALMMGLACWRHPAQPDEFSPSARSRPNEDTLE